MEIFWRLIFGHMLGDFTFQTNFINRWKRKSLVGLLVHCGMHPLFYVILTWPYLDQFWVENVFFRLTGWWCIAIIFFSHLLEDWWRVYTIYKYGMPDNTVFLAWDQIIHLTVIFAIAPLAAGSAGTAGFFPETWPVLGVLFVAVTHTCTVVIYFLEKDLQGGTYPGDDEKYLAMAERLILALCFLFPGPAGAAALASAWLCVMFFLRRRRLFDLTTFTFYMGAIISIACGLAARALYYAPGAIP
ncbi:MAG: DUF3307 domain-containing protein [Elusimicrobiota bacterium]